MLAAVQKGYEPSVFTLAAVEVAQLCSVSNNSSSSSSRQQQPAAAVCTRYIYHNVHALKMMTDVGVLN